MTYTDFAVSGSDASSPAEARHPEDRMQGMSYGTAELRMDSHPAVPQAQGTSEYQYPEPDPNPYMRYPYPASNQNPPSKDIGMVVPILSTPIDQKAIKDPLSKINSRIDNGSNYGAFLRGRPPLNVRPPLDIDIGIIEICAFFPNWLQLPPVVVRAMKAGWTRNDLAKAQLHATNALTQAELKTSEDRVQKHMSVGGKLFCKVNDKSWDRKYLDNIADFDDLTANDWAFRDAYEHRKETTMYCDALLTSITAPLSGGGWPQGSDRLLLTQCLEYANANPHLQLTTADYGHIIEKQGLTTINRLDSTYDKQALKSFRNRVANPSS